jgi:hypothetical protein
LDESHKLDAGPLDEGSRPKSGKFEAKLTWHHFGGKINWFKPEKIQEKNSTKKERAHDLKNQDARVGSPQSSNSRIQFASNESKLVPRHFEHSTPSKVGLLVWVVNMPKILQYSPRGRENECFFDWPTIIIIIPSMGPRK